MKNIDMHRNYLYGYARNPLVTVKSFRFTNNLVYNYVWEGLNTGGGMSLDAIGNKFKAGPAYPSARLPFRVFPMGGLTTPLGSPSIYVSGNVGPVTTDPAADNWPLISNSDGPGLGQNGLLGTQYRRTTPLPTLPWPVTVEPATQIESTLLPNVGASRRLDCLGDWVGNRDTVDTRVLDNYANGTGAFPTDEASVGGLPVLDAGTACADTDADGMPDVYEAANGLNLASASDGNTLHASGYTNLEMYLSGTNGSDSVNPTNPASLTATTITASRIDLSWAASTDNIGVMGYNIERCTGAVCTSWAEIQSTTGIGTTYSNTGLTSGVTYRYRVRARDAVPNYSNYSPIASATALDTILPVTTISTGDPSTILADNLTVAGSSSDNVDVIGCKWRIGSVPNVSNGMACSGTTSFSCNTSTYAFGTNTLYVGCYDAAGNYGSDSIAVNYIRFLPAPSNLRILTQ